ncbi:recombination-associated protein RdgC [Comamonas jiangduensis]|uniref:recombination-associated protein RdgC n=1 Tax=Comamonas jiangduensis TaxID=1194168 RepID=UPI003BF9191C
MFKNMIIYRIAAQSAYVLYQVEEALQKTPFFPCGATQEKSAGWVPPRGEDHGLLAESVGGQWILRFMSETKQLPAEVLNRKVQEKADAITKEYGRTPGKKEKRDLKDEAKLDLLPQAFTKRSTMWVWIDPEACLLVLDTGAQGKADEVVTLLVESLKGFGVSLLDTQTSAQAAMAHWLLSQEAPVGFSVDRECELKAADESKAVVRYGRHPLDIDEVKQHVEHGKLPTKLALTWDDRVSFVLTDSLRINKVAFTDTVLDQAGDEGGFDTDVAIATGELSKLIPDLVEALGGEGRHEIGASSDTLAVRAAAKGAITGPASAPADTAPTTAPF